MLRKLLVVLATTLLAACIDRGVHVYEIPKNGAVGHKLSPACTAFTLEKTPTCLCLSADGGFLACGGADGMLTVAAVSDLQSSLCAQVVQLHDSVAGGVSGVCLLPDTSPAASDGAAAVGSASSRTRSGEASRIPCAPGGEPAATYLCEREGQRSSIRFDKVR